MSDIKEQKRAPFVELQAIAAGLSARGDQRTSNMITDAAKVAADALEALQRERDRARERFNESVQMGVAAEARAESAEAEVARLREALAKIARVPDERPSAGFPKESCSWCNGSAEIARAAISEGKVEDRTDG